MNYHIRISSSDFNKKENVIFKADNITDYILVTILDKYPLNPSMKIEIIGIDYIEADNAGGNKKR